MKELSLFQQVPLYRNCFILVTFSGNNFSMFTYNWNHSKLDQFNSYLNKLKGWTFMRDHLMKSILHQKMGLFYHMPPLHSTRGSISSSFNTSGLKEYIYIF
jgi:hypothetical protein